MMSNVIRKFSKKIKLDYSKFKYKLIAKSSFWSFNKKQEDIIDEEWGEMIFMHYGTAKSFQVKLRKKGIETEIVTTK